MAKMTAVATATTMETVTAVTMTTAAAAATATVTASGTDNNQLTVAATVGGCGNMTKAAAEGSHTKRPGGGCSAVVVAMAA